MKKYRKGKLWWIAILLTIFAALQTPYNTGTYSLFFRLIETRKIEWLLPFVLLYIAGYALLFWVDKARVKVVNRYQAQALTEIKMDCVKDAIGRGKDTAEVISFLDNDLKLVMDNYFGNIFLITRSLSIVVFTLCLTLTSNWIFALVYLVLGLLPLKLTGILAKKVGKKTGEYTASVQQSTGIVKDLIRNKATLLNYNAIGAAVKRTENAISESETSLADRNSQMAYADLLLNIVYTIANIVPISIGIYMGMKGYLSISAFVAVQYSSGWIVGSLGSLAGLMAALKSTRPICEKIENFAEWTPDSADVCEDVETVEFSHVDFAYTLDRNILNDFSFHAEAGSKILIQGASGSGKSTLLKLISGELTPTGGKVLLNGREISSRKLGYVTQNPAMFADTIRYNLTLGKEVSEEKLFDAVEKAGLLEFVKEVGLDFELEEDGGNISGGQRQRIEIARALLYDCSVLLVDEGTSALDEETASRVHDTIMGLGKTVIEVAHYLPENEKSKFDTIIKLE